MEEMMELLRDIQRLGQYSSYFKDKLLEEDPMNFIVENNTDIQTFMHYTKEESDAKNIIQEGFRFAESFYKTALPVSKDKLDITIKHHSRKFYGEFLILICIAKDIVNFYSMELDKAGIKSQSYENILTDITPSTDDNSDRIYQLPPQYIKGYINHRTGEIVKNPSFDPWYNSPSFMNNIELLRQK
jgi:hypothetical protein